MDRSLIFVIFLASLVNISFGQYNLEWSSGNLGQYGWGGAYGFDIDNDRLVEFEVRRSGQYTFYNGNYTVSWAISFPGYDYMTLAHPRDTDGDGLLVPLNTDNDAAGEVVIAGYYFSGSAYYGRFRVYDAVTRNLEFESSLITGFYGNVTIEDIDGDSRDEIILNRFGSASTEAYVDVYACIAEIGEGKVSYGIRSSFKAYPNPASQTVTIPFSISKEESGLPLKVAIYDELGREIRTLSESKDAAPGDYRLVWDRADNEKATVPPGNYFVRIAKGQRIETKSIQLVR